MLKNKKIFLIAFAIIFLVVLFLLKTTSFFKNKETYQRANQANGLTYDNLSIEDLVNRDTDGDGIPDWEEGLYGLNPTKKETISGIPDSSAINKLKNEEPGANKITNGESPDIKDLTETEKFSRELFATIAAASQNGTMDQATIDQLGASLAEKIQNSPPRKVFSIFEIKTITDDGIQAFKNYNNALSAIYKKYPPTSYTILDVLQKFMLDENNVDVSALTKLDPIIEQTNKIIEAMIKTSVPQSLSSLHLNVINSLERLVENLNDIQLYDTDSIIALGGISKYEGNATKLESDLNSLANAINQKLNN